MAKNIERPIIFPLSNPTSRCEATPQQIVDWTEGKALIGTGSPFGPAQFKGKEVPFAQTNNSYIFTGLALGILSSHARHASDAMIKASALALAELYPTRKDEQGGSCHRYPASAPSAKAVARAVGQKAIREGLAEVEEPGLEKELAANFWEPLHETYELSKL